MKSLLLCVLTASVAAQDCAVPYSFAETSTVSRSLWSFLATLDFSPMTFERTQGYCRSGDSWSHTPALRTTMGSVTGGSNNAFGDNLWFCFAQPRTMLGCLGECEARADCLAVDRPAMDQREECCLFSGGNTGDGKEDRECYVRKQLPVEALGERAMLGTSVTVMPVPFFTILKMKMTSGERSVSSEAQRGFCPSWTWCSFKVKDCFGRTLYDVRSMRHTNMDWEGNDLLGTSVIIYMVYDGQGEYLGRTSALTDGSEPVRIYSKDNEQVALMVTAESWFLRAFFDMKWYVNVINAGTPVSQQPMQDPRLLTFIVTFNFRTLGYFGGVIMLLFCFLFFFLFLYLIWVLIKMRQGELPDCLPFISRFLAEYCSCCFARRTQLQLNDDGGYACCSGRGKRSNAWSTKFDALKPIE